MTNLYVLNGSEKGKSFVIEGDSAYVGRMSENDIQIDDSSISRRHLKVVVRDNRYKIVDLRSTNGTFINRVRINPDREYEVEEGVPIAIGKVLISFGKTLPEEAAIQSSSDFSNEISQTGIFTADRRRPVSPTKDLELIHGVANVLMQSLDINEILENILDNIFGLLKRIDRGAILLVDDNTGELEQIIGRGKYCDGKTGFNYSRAVADEVMKEGKPVMISDTSRENRSDFSDSMFWIKSVMCVPLISRSQLRGVIYVDSVNTPCGFREDDLSLITSLSSSAAIAIENALLYSNLEKKIEERTRSLRETEKRLRESEARFKAIFDNMSSGVIVYEIINDGEDFAVLDLNGASLRIEKISRKEVLGKRVQNVLPKTLDNDLPKVFKRVWETGMPEYHPVTLSDSQRIIGWREYYVYRLPSGEIVTIYDDVTDKKNAEKEHRALQEQLLASQKMEAIGILAGGTAHNFRNILQAISGNIEYLEMIHSNTSDVCEIGKNIHDSIDKGADLINNLLHFSKRGGALELEDLDLAEVIRKTCEITEKLFDKKIEIHVHLEEGLFVKGNHSLLSLVFMNLFTNARDAMPGGGTLTIKAQKNGNSVTATVSDTGEGMEKDTLEKIFDPFFTLKEVGMGTGLGLSTSHGIIEQHKGTIDVSSKPGKGTTFTIHVPMAKIEKLAKHEGNKHIVFGKGQKVMIVDDERPALDSLAKLIERLGYRAFPVNNPLEAVSGYIEWSPDMVIMDRSMPEMDGVACIKELIKTDPDAKIIIISGYEEFGANGIDEDVKGMIKGYFTKPFGAEDLGKILFEVL
ncbi:MAG: ATP-binding protein [Desulfatiglans sp.]|jgi:PAS domain S-box-containing protein|nr:ATP-binding protein [Thermodesulfobacteriota bacterium]MEE4354091.1 ATP-binding protein [Desulfatiglans sp.]